MRLASGIASPDSASAAHDAAALHLALAPAARPSAAHAAAALALALPSAALAAPALITAAALDTKRVGGLRHQARGAGLCRVLRRRPIQRHRPKAAP